ncbi:zinc ribbon domain-containing protein [Inconstantimicrobium mannanitabidum]|uniref:Transcriptional regulator n=1 Tax=Inconstantimicrobium mannanitabidum TaxID=1604901 RepID=A0ACB5RB68_9CLOT|nr:zinc ribbon domain-containing protein [Clostridium sp. TW13]GKX66372.1 transcriptional regulator [Clostridium sp. TW13]
MTEIKMCQSCGLPFNKEHAHFIAIEQDGSKSIYCTNCYKDGKFIDPNISMEEMVETIVPILGRTIGEDEARKEMTALLPTLKRWI